MPTGKDFTLVLSRIGLTPHSFRHMSISYAISKGFDIKSVSERARHEDIETTAGYTHAVEHKDKAIADVLDEYIKHD